MVEENYVRLIEAVLIFISSWPIVILLIILLFRKTVAEMLGNIIIIEIPTFIKIGMQGQDSDAFAMKADITPEKHRDPKGFYTRDGLSQLIVKSGLIKENEKVTDMILLFETRKQHTWIISTDRQLFCILDDEKTREKGRMIQWKMLLTEAEPIRARTSENVYPVVDIGERKRWLYSRHLFPTEDALENRINTLVKKEKY